MANRPFGPTGVRVFFSATRTAVAGDTSGIALEAHADGRGLVVFRYEMLASALIAMKLTSVAFLNGSLEIVTPTIISDPNATLTTVIRKGVETAGLLPAVPDYFFRMTVAGDALRGHEIFVPPGKFLTFMKPAVNSTIRVTIGFTEL